MRYFSITTFWRKNGENVDVITKSIKQFQLKAIITVHFRVPLNFLLNRLAVRGIVKIIKNNRYRVTALLK